MECPVCHKEGTLLVPEADFTEDGERVVQAAVYQCTNGRCNIDEFSPGPGWNKRHVL